MHRRLFRSLVFIILILGFSVIPAFAEANIKITAINYDGQVPRSEADEYIEITNIGDASLNIGGYVITANDGQRFEFPSWATINPGQTCRVYTNLNTGEPCTFSWGTGTARWNNEGDCAKLFDRNLQVIDERCYEGGTDDQTTATWPQDQPTNPPPSNSGGVPCPATGGWPAGCVPAGNSGSTPTNPPPSNSGGVPCPATGAWPAGCVPAGSGGSTPTNPPPSNSGGVSCPATGAWPAGCVPAGNGGSTPTNPPPSNSGGVPCPATGAWPAGCVPAGSSGSAPASNTCPTTGAWPKGCIPQ